jgi:hypothetical protein
MLQMKRYEYVLLWIIIVLSLTVTGWYWYDRLKGESWYSIIFEPGVVHKHWIERGTP